jgi:hypothetical protein
MNEFPPSCNDSNDYTVPANECLEIQWPQYGMPIMSARDSRNNSTIGDEEEVFQGFKC